MKYVFRWKDSIEVRPSWNYTEEEVWNWAIKWLRPDTMTDDVEAETFIREHGEVVELLEEKS